MKTIFLTTLMMIYFSPGIELLAGNYLPCGASTGNAIIPNPDPDILSRGFNVSVGAGCEYRVPDMRFLYISRTGRGWRQLGSITQVPAPGTRVVAASGGCIRQFIRVVFSADFHFNNGTPVNPRDDRYCSVDRIDSFLLEDKIPPVARSISITTGNPTFTATALKSLFTAASITDNCSSLATLQNNLELVTDPRRPTMVEIRCGASNTYRVSFRTRDACGNYSNWAIATVTFRDNLAPVYVGEAFPYYFLDLNCRTKITPTAGDVSLPGYFKVRFTDDYTPEANIRLSYRILSPSAHRGNIPTTGIWINRSGYCPASVDLVVRVCAQDCFGNGNLYSDSDSEAGVGLNCRLITLKLMDTTRPQLISLCDTTDLPSNLSCQATMPNLTTSLAWADGCTSLSNLSIYQFPAPGSILNDGVDNEIGLARGPARTYTCSIQKPADPAVACGSTGDYKTLQYIPVHFIVVDCDGNCRVIEGCQYINLYKTPGASPSHGFYASPLSFKSTNQEKLKSSSMYNVPNPFHDFTDIQLSGLAKGTATLQFYFPDGRTLMSRKLALNSGQNVERIYTQDFDTKGLIFYSLEYIDFTTGQIQRIYNKMVIQ